MILCRISSFQLKLWRVFLVYGIFSIIPKLVSRELNFKDSLHYLTAGFAFVRGRRRKGFQYLAEMRHMSSDYPYHRPQESGQDKDHQSPGEYSSIL